MVTCLIRVRQLPSFLWLLSITPQLSWGQVQVNDLLGGLNLGYSMRLEAQFPYQQALLPLGATSSRSYCEEVGSTWLLSMSEVEPRATYTGTGKIVLPQQEFYALRYLNGHWRSFFMRHYSVSPVSNGADVRLPAHDLQFYNIALSGEVAREEVVYLHHNFDPIRLLEQQVPAQPVASFFYVLDAHPSTWGDTLAAYFFQQAASKGTCSLTLWRRKEPLAGHWQGQRYQAQSWEYSPTTRLLTCRQGGANGAWSEWRRQYAATGSNYVEVLLESGMVSGGSSGLQYNYQAYERQHTCVAGQLRDKYTVAFPDPTRSDLLPNGQVSFTIVTEVE